MSRFRTLATVAAVAVLVMPSQSGAQLTLGFAGGVMRTSISVEPAEDFETDSRTGTFVGASLGIPLTDVLSVTIGGVYAEKGSNFGADFFGSQIDLEIAGNYLSVPVTVQFALHSGERAGLSIFAGPTFGIETKCELRLSVTAGTGSGSCEDGVTIIGGMGSFSMEGLSTKSLDIGGGVGAVASFAAGESVRVFVKGGYDLGVRDVLGDDEFFTSAKNRALFVGAGVAFPLGG